MSAVLKDIQEAIQNYILEEDPSAFEEIRVKDVTEKRLKIYQNGYYFRLVEVLQGHYMALYKILGANAFSSMIRDYLTIYPSHHYSLQTVGRYLPRFLENTSGCEPSFVELAQFEWAMNEALWALDAPLLTIQHLVQLQPEEWATLKFNCHPSVHLLPCYYNTAGRWDSLDKHDQDIPSEFYEKSHGVLIWRQDNEAKFCELSLEHSALLQAIQANNDFSTVCEIMLDYFDEDSVVQHVSSALQEWIMWEIFSVEECVQGESEGSNKAVSTSVEVRNSTFSICRKR